MQINTVCFTSVLLSNFFYIQNLADTENLCYNRKSEIQLVILALHTSYNFYPAILLSLYQFFEYVLSSKPSLPLENFHEIQTEFREARTEKCTVLLARVSSRVKFGAEVNDFFFLLQARSRLHLRLEYVRIIRVQLDSRNKAFCELW